jgi:hypothetical protein
MILHFSATRHKKNDYLQNKNPKKVKRKPFNVFMKKYCALTYANSYNLGDCIQSLAAAQFLPEIHAFVDRDVPSEDLREQHYLICNGWFHSKFTLFPLPKNVKPLFISFHLNETDDPLYVDLPRQAGSASIASHVDYLKLHQPFGTRDYHTQRILEKAGVRCYFSGCLTLTLQNRVAHKQGRILIVDVDDDLLKHIPSAYRERAVFVSQLVSPGTPHDVKMKLAQDHLNLLGEADLVFTGRLHTALPCLAFGTRVVLIHKNLSDVRFEGLLGFLHAFSGKIDLDLETFQNKPLPIDLISSMVQKVRAFVGTNNIPKAMNLKPGRSIIAACRNRVSHLVQTLPTWILSEPDEIILIDWGTTPPLSLDALAKETGHDLTKVILVSVPNVDRWVLTKAYNLAASFSSYENLLKVDCDTLLNPNFFYYHALTPYDAKSGKTEKGVFFAGDWQRARDENERHTNGIVYLPRRDFDAVGGYDSLITTYGFDDCALYRSLAQRGSTRLLLNMECVSHLKHSDRERTDQQNPLDVEIELNRLIDELNLERCPSQFRVFQRSSFHFIAEYMAGAELNPVLRRELLDKAQQNRAFAKVSRKASEPAKVTENEKAKSMQENEKVQQNARRDECAESIHKTEITSQNETEQIKNTRPKLFLDVLNGLGNRLRALASGFAVAQATKRDLIVIWQSDFHCEALFDTLFEAIPNISVIARVPEMRSNVLFYDYVARPNEKIDTSSQKDTSQKDIYVRTGCVLNHEGTSWRAENLFLRDILRPKADILSEIERLDALHGISSCIGVHVRMGQNQQVYAFEDTSAYRPEAKAAIERWRQCSHFTVFIQEMKRLLRGNESLRFFVCCDAEAISEEFRKEFGDRVVCLERTSFDRSTTQLRTAVIDMWLLARTIKMLAANWSSFSEGAHRIGGKAWELAGVHFGLPREVQTEKVHEVQEDVQKSIGGPLASICS